MVNMDKVRKDYLLQTFKVDDLKRIAPPHLQEQSLRFDTLVVQTNALLEVIKKGNPEDLSNFCALVKSIGMPRLLDIVDSLKIILLSGNTLVNVALLLIENANSTEQTKSIEIEPVIPLVENWRPTPRDLEQLVNLPDKKDNLTELF